jgi:hypothetical protein
VPRRMTLPDDLGGLRSVSCDAQRSWLLVGAARGVWALKAADGEIVGRFEVPGAEQPRTGFNAAILAGDTLLATHSQLGAWRWPLASPGAPQAFLRPVDDQPKSIRCLLSVGAERVALAAEDAILVFNAAGEKLAEHGCTGGEVSSLAVLDGVLYVGTARGMVLRDRLDGGMEAWEVLHRGSTPIESLQVRRWSDLIEVVVPAGPLGVRGLYPDEGLVTELLPAAHPIRRAWVADDVIVALNESRDRLFVANANTPARAAREVAVSRLVSRSIQDACIVTGAARPTPPV